MSDDLLSISDEYMQVVGRAPGALSQNGLNWSDFFLEKSSFPQEREVEKNGDKKNPSSHMIGRSRSLGRYI